MSSIVILLSTLTVISLTEIFFSFLCCYHKSLDCSLVGQVQIVCSLHERHKGQFHSTLPPSLTLHLVLGWRQGSSMVGQTEEEKRRGWRAGRRHSELLRVCLAYCPAAPSFLYPLPTLSSPCWAPIQQIASGGPHVDIFLQVLDMTFLSF